MKSDHKPLDPGPSREVSRGVSNVITGASAGAVVGSLGGAPGAVAGAVIGAIANLAFGLRSHRQGTDTTENGNQRTGTCNR